MRIKNLLFILLLAGITGSHCKKQTIGSDVQGSAFQYKSGDVLLAGAILMENKITSIATYWKNNTMTRLSKSTNASNAWGIAISGNDILIVGNIFNSATTLGTSTSTAVYWKNGQEIALAGIGSSATDITVSGNDVFIAGRMMNANNRVTAVYWKNGVVNVLAGDPLRHSSADEIFVSGNDIYVAGYTTDANGMPLATYWKNNIPVVLSGNGSSSHANSIFVSGNDIYVGGRTTNNIPGRIIGTYWKNGTPFHLETQNSEVYSVTVAGNNFHIAGYAEAHTHTGPAYWKNSVFEPLPATVTAYSRATCMVVSGSDVYLGGDGNSMAMWWKNGVEHKLSDGTYVNGICVAP
jgi:hypothetical protein